MKRILTIAIVICLAVTMTCSSMAVEERGLKVICPKCGANADSVRYEDHLILTTTTRCTHGYSDATDTIRYYGNYTEISCPNCGVYRSDVTYLRTTLTCNGG